MGILSLPLDETEKTFVGEPKQCFSCGIAFYNRLDPFVYWSGHECVIHLHPDCAKRLGIALIGDAAIVRDRVRARRNKKALADA